MYQTRKNEALHLHGTVLTFPHVEVCSTAITLPRVQGLDRCQATVQVARLTAILAETLLQTQSSLITVESIPTCLQLLF